THRHPGGEQTLATGAEVCDLIGDAPQHIRPCAALLERAAELEGDATAAEEQDAQAALREVAVERETHADPVPPEGDGAVEVGALHDDVVDRMRDVGRWRQDRSVGLAVEKNGNAVVGFAAARPRLVTGFASEAQRAHSGLSGDQLDGPALEGEAM